MATTQTSSLARQNGVTFMQAVWPAHSEQENFRAWAVRSLCLAFGFSLLIGLCAHATFRLPGQPVPFTMQTFGVLLTGALLGSRLGAATLGLYLVEGIAGLPVFAPDGSPASAGYLVGFLAAAWLVGLLAERRWDRNVLKTALMMLAGSALIYLFGVLWLAHFVGGMKPALVFGMYPFLLWDAAKAALAAAVLPAGWKLLGAKRG